MIEIDGAYGEGGGQILRSSLALACITGKPVRVFNIRAGRSKPGLRPQHLAGLKAAAAISKADLEGARVGSKTAILRPGQVQSGQHRIDVGTAGSCSLVLQTILIPLALSSAPSTVTIRGGSHVPFSPLFEYLRVVWLPALTRLGLQVELSLDRAGFMPKGGGEIRAHIKPWTPSGGLQLNGGGPVSLTVIAGQARLPDHVSARMLAEAESRLLPAQTVEWRDETPPSDQAGAYFLLVASGSQRAGGFAQLGRRGRPAEHLAAASIDKFEIWNRSGAGSDPYLADQLMLPALFGPEPSRYTTQKITAHLRTNAWVLGHFYPDRVRVIGELGQPGAVEIQPA